MTMEACRDAARQALNATLQPSGQKSTHLQLEFHPFARPLDSKRTILDVRLSQASFHNLLERMTRCARFQTCKTTLTHYTEYRFLDLVMQKEATDVWVHRCKTHWDAFLDSGMLVTVSGSDRMPYSSFPSATGIDDRRDVCKITYHLPAFVALHFEFNTNLAGERTFRVWFTVPLSKLVPDQAARIVCDALAELKPT